MMCERSHFNIVVGINIQTLRKTLRSVGLSVVCERFGNFTEISVKYAFETALPCRGQLLVRTRHHYVEVCLQNPGEFSVHRLFLAVVSAFEGFFGNSAVHLPDVRNIVCRSALGEIDLTVHADILISLIEITLAHYEHIAQVDLRTTLAKNLIFKESVGRETPACSRLVLIAHRSRFYNFHIGKLEPGAVGIYHLVVGRHIQRRRYCQ